MISRHSLQWKLVFWIALFVLLTTGIVGLLSFSLFRKSLLEVSDEYLQGLAIEGTKKIDLIMENNPESYAEEVVKEVDSVAQNLFIPKGMTGYAYIMDSSGVLRFHPKSVGLNIGANEFAQEMLMRKSGLVKYVWEGRSKTVAYRTLSNGMIYAVGSYDDEFEQPIYDLGRMTALVCLLSLIIAGGTSVLVTRSIIRPLREVEHTMNLSKDGDFRQRVQIESSDELGSLARSYNTMISNIGKLIRKAAESSLNVAALAEELSVASEQTSKSSNEISSTIQHLYAEIQQIAASVQILSHSAYKTGGSTQSGKRAAERAIQKFEEIRASAVELNRGIMEMGEQSDKIGQIMEVMTTIVDQTNLLALNASIEAARAGDQGRGFAVLADEIKKLAQESAVSAAEVKTLIKDIQQKTKRLTHNMEEGNKTVDDGWLAVQNAFKSFNQIADLVNRNVEGVKEVSSATQSMADGATQIVHVVESQNKAVNEVSLSAQELARSAEELQDEINTFKI